MYRSVGEAAQVAGVSIHSILQHPIVSEKGEIDFVVTTDEIAYSQMETFASVVRQSASFTGTPLFLPILS